MASLRKKCKQESEKQASREEVCTNNQGCHVTHATYDTVIMYRQSSKELLMHGIGGHIMRNEYPTGSKQYYMENHMMTVEGTQEVADDLSDFSVDSLYDVQVDSAQFTC